MSSATKKIFRFKILILAIAVLNHVGGLAQNRSDSTRMAIELTEYAVHYVKDKKPYKYRDSEFNLKVSNTAYLVTFTFASEPRIMDRQVNFFIGDYRIPEYGGLEKGIYFRIYDSKLLQSLNDQAISYQVADAKKISLRKKFVTPDIGEMKLVDEATIIKKKPK